MYERRRCIKELEECSRVCLKKGKKDRASHTVHITDMNSYVTGCGGNSSGIHKVVVLTAVVMGGSRQPEQIYPHE